MECLQREYQVKNITVPDSEAFNFTFDSTPATEKGSEEKTRYRACLPALRMAGHTGYLTFATWPKQICST